jgi:hypothetical protein
MFIHPANFAIDNQKEIAILLAVRDLLRRQAISRRFLCTDK